MLYYKMTALNSPIHRKIRTKTNPIQTAGRWMRHIKAPWSFSNNLWVEAMLKEQICNQCTSRLSRYLWYTYESGGTFPTSFAVARSRFLAGVAITNISMQLALLYSELDYLTYNPTSRHSTGYTFTWPGLQLSPCGHCNSLSSHFTKLRLNYKYMPYHIDSSNWKKPNAKCTNIDSNHKITTDMQISKNRIRLQF